MRPGRRAASRGPPAEAEDGAVPAVVALTRLPTAGLLFAMAWLLLLLLSELIVVELFARYALVAALGFAICAYALTWPPRPRAGFVLGLFLVGIALYLAEAILTAGTGRRLVQKPPGTLANELRNRGIDAYPAVFPALHVDSDGQSLGAGKILPLAGISAKLTVCCNETGRDMVYRSDRYGFNNPDEVYEAPADIALVGDSFTHGFCVQPGEDVGGQLRRLGWRAVNLGYGSQGPLLELATVREYAAPMRPRYVVWLYYEGNDLRDLDHERRSATLLRYLDAGFSQGLASRRDEVSAALEDLVRRRAGQSSALREALRDSRAVQFLRLAQVRHATATTLLAFPELGGGPYGEHDSEILGMLVKALARAKADVDGWRGQLHFLYLPASSRYVAGVDHARLHSRARVLAAVRALQIPVIDFHATVEAMGDPSRIFPHPDAHLSAAGYALLARTIDEALRGGAGRAITPSAAESTPARTRSAIPSAFARTYR